MVVWGENLKTRYFTVFSGCLKCGVADCVFLLRNIWRCGEFVYNGAHFRAVVGLARMFYLEAT